MATADHRPHCLASNRGFTIVELLVTFMIISALAAIALLYMGDIRKRSADAAAITEGRNLINAVSYVVLQKENVDFTVFDTATGRVGNPVIYTLPAKVRIDIADNDPGSGTYNLDIRLWHLDGSPGSSADGRREFAYYIDEAQGTVDMEEW